MHILWVYKIIKPSKGRADFCGFHIIPYEEYMFNKS